MSSVILQTIQWSKCFSFGEGNIIHLNKEPVTQIIAPNGYGKSSIPLVMEEALYNKNSKGIKKGDIPNRLLDGSYNIKLDFAVDTKNYSIIIERGSNIKVKLSEDGNDISSHTATNTFKQIEELIGLDFKTFQQLVYQSTNSSLEFLTATDSNRKKFLINLFDLSEYTRLFETFKAAAKDLQIEVAGIDSKVSTINGWLKNNSEIDLNKKKLLELPERPDYSEEINELNVQVSNIKTINANIAKNKKLKETLSKIDIDELRNVNVEKVSYDKYQSEIGELKSAKTTADNVIKKLKGLEDKCPTCLQDIDRDFYDNLLLTNTTESTKHAERIKELEKVIAQIKEKNNLFDTTQEKIREWEQLSQSIDLSTSDSFLDAKEVEQRLVEIRNLLSEVEDKIAAATKSNNAVIKHNSRIDIYLEQNEKFKEELILATSGLDTLNNKYKNLEVLKKAFSTNGVIAYKLENLVKDLEEFTNEYLSELSDGRFTIQFSIASDKLNVVVTDEGREISIMAPSSGEMARINIATLLAIRRLMSSISKNTINVLFLDEVISVLDDFGREKLVEVLLEEENLNTFLVSHGWTGNPLVDKLELKKENNISRVEYG
jgi:DNA repair exonuclease SbcCD ATPase subunit